jgi:predicted nucleotidyltransferase
MFNREEVLQILKEHLLELHEQFAVKSLALFGSVARNEATENSDIDLLVEFQIPVGFDGYMNLKCYLEDLFSQPIDLIMKNALKNWTKSTIEKEIIYVA